MALSQFLLLTDPTPAKLQGKVIITNEFRSLMNRAGATKYPLEIKRKAELELLYDYTHIDYKRQRCFIDQILPEKPKAIEIIESAGRLIGFIILTGFRFWWVILIVFVGWGIYSNSSQPSHIPNTSSGHSNTFGANGTLGGNSTSKSVTDSPQVKDGSGQAGFGNGGLSGHDALDTSEATITGSTKKATGPTISESSEVTSRKNITANHSSKAVPIKSAQNMFDHKEGHFTLGSTKDEVIAVMGEPDTEFNTSISYGFSLVFFNKDKVSGWSQIHHNLKVSIGDKKSGAQPFTVGSTKRQVVDAMGTPSAVNGSTFSFGYSQVFFDAVGKVSGWSQIDSRLNVNLGDIVEGAEPFKVGSTIDEVVAVMGTPDSYNATSISYGYSIVFLQNGKVSSFSDISKNLKVK
ncbi:hypothetical protein [Paenibacillus chitinolyticus]|uniref:hypothetical protein n=1 Tax=Paenibacillus chitinolyticus TaxID=79263 RepID=UPI00295EFBB9|nr:hypothetical protein [Paenibacillus chitinolyticus]